METKINDNSNVIFEQAQFELELDRNLTRENISNDVFKISEALCNIPDLSIEGKIIRDDLLGLLEFENNEIHQIDALMIERRKAQNSDKYLYNPDNKSHVLH